MEEMNMNMTKPAQHTPGPWQSKPAPTTKPAIDIYVPGEHIARVYRKGHGNDEANARLIVAAPEMLEIIRELADRVQINSRLEREHVEKSRALLAQIEGRSA